MQAMADLPIRYIELGYRNLARSNCASEYYYLPRLTIERVFTRQTVKPYLRLQKWRYCI